MLFTCFWAGVSGRTLGCSAGCAVCLTESCRGDFAASGSSAVHTPTPGTQPHDSPQVIPDPVDSDSK